MYRVIVVDDESIIREGLAQALVWERLGYKVVGTASHGLDALAQIKEKKPDVVIVDVKMPIMDGIELSKHISMKYPFIKVIILSGFSNFEYAQKAIEYNVFSYVLKPINENEICKKLEELHTILDMENKTILSKEKQTFSSNENYLIDYYLSGLINGYADYLDDYKDALDKLTLHIQEKSLCVIACLFENSQTTEPNPDMQKIYKITNEMGNINAYYLFNGRYFYIILHNKYNLTKREIHSFLKYLKNQLENNYDKCNGNIWIGTGVGNIYSGLTSLHKSANEALKALELCFFEGRGSINFYNSINEQKKTTVDNEYIIKAVNDIITAVQSMNDISLMRSIRCLLDNLKYIGYDNLNVFYIKIMYAYQLLAASLKEVDSCLQIQSEENVFQIIMQSNTFEDLRADFIKIVKHIYNNYKNIKNIGEDGKLIHKIKSFILLHYTEDLSLDYLASTFYLNSSYISSLFKEKTGENISEFILSVRIDNAKKMLQSSNKQIQNIAQAVGYKDYRYFCTVFKKVTGSTPLKYRLKKLLQ